MKRVRFITPINKGPLTAMKDSDCHSPRPFIEKNLDCTASELPSGFAREIVYSPDPVKRFECSDSSPYPILDKTYLSSACDTGNQCSPCSDLELSILDCNNHQPRKPVYFTPVGNLPLNYEKVISSQNVQQFNVTPESPINVLSPIDNTKMVAPPNILNKDDNFFITRGGLKKFQLHGSLQVQMNKLSLGKENSCKQTDVPITKAPVPDEYQHNCNLENRSCSCHHCVRISGNFNTSTPGVLHVQNPYSREDFQNGIKQPMIQASCNHCVCIQTRHINTPQHCSIQVLPPKHQNEQTNNQCTDVEKQMNVAKEKREPTVGDLLKIIKLQNEQLQLLQEKVDKLISTKNCGPMQNFVTERVALETIDHDKHNISIGVMTSLEMVRTSTIINKEQVVQQTYDNAQVQCNRSEISIKEIVKQPVNLNFLDGILPVGKAVNLQTTIHESLNQHVSNFNEEKTLNELSLYNVQVDNATTPLMSPEQSLYLDVRDYSGSDSGSDHSNVGWTYYNKVMTHVNGMLQDSDMPSSASALYRNTRQHCLQMQIDKTNISVTKRVTFGDDQVVQQPILCTDTSMKMNQLAAKYLKTAPSASAPAPAPRQGEMSFATRNYMERHKLIQGSRNYTVTVKRRQDVSVKQLFEDGLRQVTPQRWRDCISHVTKTEEKITPLAFIIEVGDSGSDSEESNKSGHTFSKRLPPGEMPRFLDITTLKQQPKLL